MPRKITRIFLRLSGALFMVLLVTLLALFFAIQTPGFQTWLGKRVGKYLSNELNTTLRINKIKLEFFKNAELGGVFLLDHHHDTIFAGDVFVQFSLVDLRDQKIKVQNATLQNSTAKLIKYKKDTVFNYQFLADYFGGSSSDSKVSAWDVQVKNITLENVAVVYRREEKAGVEKGLIDYDDIWLQHITGRVSQVQIDSNKVKLAVHGLSAFEKSGFRLEQFDTKAEIGATELWCDQLRITTPGSFVKGELRFRFESWDDYDEFVDKVYMSGRLDDSTVVNTPDIAFFASEVKGLDKKITLNGKVKGFVNDLQLSDFSFAFGEHTSFSGDLAVSGITDYPSSFLHMDARYLTSSYTDLMSLPAYPFSEGARLEIPEEIGRLGLIRYQGKLDGFASDLTTYGTISTRLGSARTHLNLRSGEKNPVVQYNGTIKTFDFNLGALFNTPVLGNINIDANINGKGLDLQTLDAELEGMVKDIDFNRYRYKDIRINGTFREKLFTGLVISRDPNADFDFNGTIDFKKGVPEMDFISTLNRLDLYTLNFTTRADSGYLASQIMINIHGDNIDNLSGVVNLDNTVYRTPAKTYELSTFNIVMQQETAEKKIKIQSAYVNAMVQGRYELSNLPGAFKSLLYHYYPTFFKKPVSERNYQDQLSFRMRVKNFNSIVELFLPEFRISAGSMAEGDFDAAAKKLNFQFRSPEISYSSIKLQELLVILNETENTVISEISGKSLRVTDSLGFTNFEFAARSVDKDSEFNLEWDNLREPSNKGRVAGNLNFGNDTFTLRNHLFTSTINDSTWNLHKPYNITLAKDGSVEFDSLRLTNNRQVIAVNGRLSDDPLDSLVLSAAHVSMHQFNPLLQIWKLDMKGFLDGHVALSRNDKGLAFNGNLVMSDLVLNKNTIGELHVNANYNAGAQQIHMKGYTSLGLRDENGRQARNISFDGTYYLDREKESLDFDFAARPANLSVLNPFLEDIITFKHAFVNGQGRIHGSPSDVKIDGEFRLFNSEIKVDYTNVSYNVTGLIEVMPDQIRFSDMLMREKGTRAAPQGTINGNIFHRNFDRMQIDYDITYRNMLVLNTTEKDNSTFYGRVYGSGFMGIYGFINDLHMEIDNTTKKNSQFFLPLDGPAEIGESDFIHFVKKDTAQVRKRRELTGFDLEMVIHATPDAQAQIILDKQHGDALTAQGEGDLTLRLNTLGKFEMFGDYVITNGYYLFTLENVINKRFEIEPGSSISWSGNPYNAEIDIVTTYRQRTSIAVLLNDLEGTQYKGRVPVECHLLINGRLFTPQIKFEIDFPTIESNAKARIASVLSDEAELNRQVFSFLLFRSFVTPQIFNQHGGGVTAGGAAASTGSEMLSNRVSDFLNAYFGSLTGISDLQLGLNYRPGSPNSTEAVDLALSKQFLNNKISVDGNFGVNNNPQINNSGALIGDVNIDYKLSEDGRYRLKGFNRSNDNTQIATAGGPYTQGIGFFYREEFETFQELFARYLKKVKKNDQQKKNDQPAGGDPH